MKEKFEVEMKKLVVKNLEDKKVKKFSSKSELFRYLYKSGLEVSEIVKVSGSCYSFVYGVVSGMREFEKRRDKKKGEKSKSEMFREKFSEGLSVGEVSRMYNSNYSWVYSVYKKWKEGIKVK